MVWFRLTAATDPLVAQASSRPGSGTSRGSRRHGRLNWHVEADREHLRRGQEGERPVQVDRVEDFERAHADDLEVRLGADAPAVGPRIIDRRAGAGLVRVGDGRWREVDGLVGGVERELEGVVAQRDPRRGSAWLPPRVRLKSAAIPAPVSWRKPRTEKSKKGAEEGPMTRAPLI